MKKALFSGVTIFLFLLLTLSFAQDKEVKDPVCGMKLKVSDVGFKSEYKGKTYYFCSSDCKAKFDKEPEKYAVKEEPKKEAELKTICCALKEELGKDLKIEKKETEKGLILTMTSANPEIVKKIQEAVGKCKMKEGKMEHMSHTEHKETKHEECCLMHSSGVKSTVTNLENGVRIELTSENPDVLKKIKICLKESSCGGVKEHKH